MRASRNIGAALVLLALVAISPTAGAATPAVVVTFADPAGQVSGPAFMTRGPDGAIWFTNSGTTNNIGRITTAGSITTFTDPTGTLVQPNWITTGPDGALWFTAGNYPDSSSVGRITTAGDMTVFPISSPGQHPDGIAVGADGALWFGGYNAIRRMTTDGTVTTFDHNLGGVSGVARGSDGAIWFGLQEVNTIGRITTSGSITSFSVPDGLGTTGLVLGPDGAIWAADSGSSQIDRITTTGAVTTYPRTDGIPGSATDITVGADGALWFTNGETVGRITTAGVTTMFEMPSIVDLTEGIASGADGAIWFSSTRNHRIARMTLPPGEPTVTSVTASGDSATVTWIAGPGGPVTNYTVTASPGGGSCSVTGPPLSCTINGLTPGTPYTFAVAASGPGGTTVSPGSPGATTTPTTTPTTAPTTVGTPSRIAHTGVSEGTQWLAGIGALWIGLGLIAMRASRRDQQLTNR